jgi:uncharacterized protein YecT (DUF1311 family)
LISWLRLVLAAVAVAGAEPESADGSPRSIAGTWDVEHVAVDGQDALHWGYRPDDPQLVGRILVIEGGRVTFEDGKEIGCKQVAWPARKADWSTLIGKGFPRPADGGRSRTPTPEDFELKVAKKDSAIVYSLCPSAGQKAPRFPQDHWLAVRGSEQLALHYDNQVLLLLRRRPPGSKPTASFDCAKAASPTEKAICGDFNLAAWDRSVAQAFRLALERNPDEAPTLRQQQKSWLHERDTCGGRADCIDEQQWQRVGLLMRK